MENIRTIERLRAFIKHKLEARDYDEDGENEKDGESKDEVMRDVDGARETQVPTVPSPVEKTESESLYPVLRAVEAAE